MTTGLYAGGEFLVPWRNVSKIESTGDIIYYTAERSRGCVSCLPSSSSKLARNCIHIDGFTEENPDAPSNDVLTGRSVLVIVNPKSGTGAASKVKSNVHDVITILSEAGLEAVVRYTERPRHAIEIIKEYSLEKLSVFAAIASLGGDGTLHEVLNGLQEVVQSHKEASHAWTMVPPLGVIPGGSGNAIAVSARIMSAKHGALNIVHSLRSDTAKPGTMMTFSCPSETGSERLLVCGIQWGLVADVDQGTEHLRWLGDVRFDLAAVAQIIKKTTAAARIRVTVDPEKTASVNHAVAEASNKHDEKDQLKEKTWGEEVSEDTLVLDNEFVMVVAWNSSMVGDGFMLTPYAKVTELGVFDVIAVRSGVSRGEMLQILLSVEDGSFMTKSDKYIYLKARSITFEKIEGQYLTVDGESVPVKPFTLTADSGDRLRILDSFSDH